LIHPQVTRGITLGVAAATAAVSTAVAQIHTSIEANGQSRTASPVLAAERLQVIPRLELESSEGALAAAQAKQFADQSPGSGVEVGARAPTLVKRAQPTPPAAQNHPAAGTASQPPVVAGPPSPPTGSVQDIIVKAFTPFGPAAVQWGLRVARCESGYNPSAVNPAGPYYGLFQFLMSTFRATPYGGQNILDPVANASAAAWKYGNGGAGAWGCR
jgi:Transglycosylase SLT domain